MILQVNMEYLHINIVKNRQCYYLGIPCMFIACFLFSSSFSSCLHCFSNMTQYLPRYPLSRLIFSFVLRILHLYSCIHMSTPICSLSPPVLLCISSCPPLYPFFQHVSLLYLPPSLCLLHICVIQVCQDP